MTRWKREEKKTVQGRFLAWTKRQKHLCTQQTRQSDGWSMKENLCSFFLSFLSSTESQQLCSTVVGADKKNATLIWSFALFFLFFRANNTKTAHKCVSGSTKTSLRLSCETSPIKMFSLLSLKDRATLVCVLKCVFVRQQKKNGTNRVTVNLLCRNADERRASESEKKMKSYYFCIVVHQNEATNNSRILIFFSSFTTLLCLIEGKFLIAAMQKKGQYSRGWWIWKENVL